MRGLFWVRVFALLDVVVTAPLVLPGAKALWISLLLSAGGLLPVPAPWVDVSPAGLLFAQLVGVLGACWNGARLAWPQDRRLVGIDAFARLVVAALLATAVVVHEAPPALGVFVVSELLGAVVAFFALRRRRSSW